MGVTSNIYAISVYILIVHYGTAYADTNCYSSALGDVYNCPDDMVCCSTDLRGCCTSPTFTSFSSVDYDGVISFLTAALIVFAVVSCCCLLCSCCRRRRSGVVYASGVTSTVVSLPPQTQGYHSYPPGQPPYPPNTGYNPYYGVPPPEYQSTVTNPVSSPHIVPVVPVASAPPAMWLVNQVWTEDVI